MSIYNSALQFSKIKSSKLHQTFKSTMEFHHLGLVVVSVMLGMRIMSTTGTVFTLHNNCAFTIWPGTLSGNGAAVLRGGGFLLSSGARASFSAPAGWSGRFWARTGCNFDSLGKGTCTTGDCDGVLRCTRSGATPVTLAEFTLGSGGTKDFYDVSLVDGYNVGVGIQPSTAVGVGCKYAGCMTDVNTRCPPELKTAGGKACKSACAAFGTPEYCCTGAHSSPSTCSPTKYSQLFKAACPTAYSYAYDDATSTCTCNSGTSYDITFCPEGNAGRSPRHWMPWSR